MEIPINNTNCPTVNKDHSSISSMSNNCNTDIKSGTMVMNSEINEVLTPTKGHGITSFPNSALKNPHMMNKNGICT